MYDAQATPQLGMHVVDGVLMVQTPDDFGDETFKEIRRMVLNKVYAMSIRGVLIDVSTIRMIDSIGYGLLADTARTVTLLGAKIFFVGFQPGVVSSLIDLEVDCNDILTAQNSNDALAQLRPAPSAAAEDEWEDTDEEQDVDTPEEDEAHDGDEPELKTPDPFEDTENNDE
ncbi:rsbT antagonist protein RsbS [Desulfobaculum xiamenense]|uniref:RsbT antagonist protein RsbS n=1 Tax=Desulfobaculum xiamenense TaxID=995050 RepID=A0A846QMS1_9BACT|nr:STAS domain-containing protein [Desulfobaculum xiamenense]NJB69428.1 rsbT antagonist protein RsbS [Desulfobaculum xiamenense]